VTAAARLLLATVAASAALLLAGFGGVAHAASCATHTPRHLSWSRSPGAAAGMLRWRSPLTTPLEVGYRVYRSGALIGLARGHHAAIRVTPRRTYTFSVRMENLVTGHLSVCTAKLVHTIAYYPPGRTGGLAESHLGPTSVHLTWNPARRGDGRLSGYRVYRNGEVVGQIEATHLTVRNLFSDTPYAFYVRAVDVNGIQGHRSKLVRVTTTGPAQTTGNASAFVLESDGQSFADLQQHYTKVGTIFPTYFNCTPSGGIMGADDPLVTGWAQARGITVEPRYNCQNMAALKAILTNHAVQQSLIVGLVAQAVAHNYQGINIDFESNDASQWRNQLSAFAGSLASSLHAEGKKLSIEVSAAYYNQLTGRAGFYDYHALSAVADQVVVMAWGKSWATSPPGGLDPMPWFQSVLKYTATMPVPSKFTVIMTMYGIDWPAGGGPSHPGTPLEWTFVHQEMERYHQTPIWDTTDDDPHFAYTDASGVHHDVWYSNARTIADRIAIARKLGMGIGFWRLGREAQNIWDDPGIR
jgi:spore germination protein YaaH